MPGLDESSHMSDASRNRPAQRRRRPSTRRIAWPNSSIRRMPTRRPQHADAGADARRRPAAARDRALSPASETRAAPPRPRTRPRPSPPSATQNLHEAIRRTRRASTPPRRRDRRHSSRPALMLAAIAVPSARPVEAHARELSHRFRPRFASNRDQADDDRRARVPQRVEARRRNLHDRIADDAGRVEEQRARRPWPSIRVELAALEDQLRRSGAPAPSGRSSPARSASASAACPTTASCASRRERGSRRAVARSGIAAVATDTPKMPIGMYINRNA